MFCWLEYVCEVVDGVWVFGCEGYVDVGCCEIYVGVVGFVVYGFESL